MLHHSPGLLRICGSLTFVLSFAVTSQAQKPAEGMTPQPVNYTTFSTMGSSGPDALPYNAPCTECTEDLAARTEFTRSFRGTGKNAGKVYSQSGYSPLHLKDASGRWISVDGRLRPLSAGVYGAPDQHAPVRIDLDAGHSIIKNEEGEIRYNNRPELLWKTETGLQSLGRADFSRYTAGDDGVRIMDVWPGVDMEIRALLGGLKTNFVLRERPSQAAGELIIRDEIMLSGGLRLTEHEEGFLVETASGREAFNISSCIGYDDHPSRNNGVQNFRYARNGNTLDIILPLEILQDPQMVYPYTVDPLVNSSNTLAQGSITGSAYSATCFVNYCSYNLSVPTPANATIVDALWSFNYVAAGSCWLYDGAVTFTTGGCASPNQAGYYWFCNGIGAGTCTGSNISLYSDVAPCMPAPSCTPQNLPFTMRFYRCYSNSAGCSNSCIGAASPWTITLVGQTVAVVSASVNGSGSTTICQGSSATLSASGTWGVPPYTYTWNPGNINGSPVSVSPSSSTTYTLTMTDACSQTATANVTVNVTPQPAAPSLNSNSPVCAGQTLNLGTTATGVTYVWSGPNGFTSSAQNPSIGSITAAGSGTYSLYTVASGCTSATATVNVVVNPVPAAPSFTHNAPLCEGQTLNLNTASAGSAYIWSGPNGFSSTVQNPTISGITAAGSGNYNLSVVVSGCTSAVSTQNIVINPAPATPVITGNSPLCTGNTLNLGTTVTGATYTWNGPGGFTSGLQNPSLPSVTPANSGNYTLEVVVSGCTSAVATYAVTVTDPPAMPTAGSNSPVCQGQPINLSGTSVAGVNYNWSGPNGFSSTAQNPVINPATAADAGTYSLYVVAGSCTSATATVNVTVNPVPAAPVAGGNAPVCAGQPLNLTGTGGGTGSYVWSGPNGFSSPAQNPVINPATVADSGQYSLYIVENGCTSATVTYNAVVHSLPATPVATANTPVCVGSAINLSTSTATAGSYAWSGPNGFSSTLQNPVIASATLADGGNYTLVIVQNGCSSAAATVTVNVINPPVTPAFTTNSPVCAGQTITLTATAFPIVTYVWSGPNGFSGTGQVVNIPSATAAEAGTYSLVITAAGCTSAAVTQNVVVNPTPATPVAGGNSPLCAGQTLNLTSTGTGTFVWSGPNSFSSGTQNPSIPSVTAADAGNYSVYVVQNGCTSATATYTVTVNAIPATPVISSNTPVCLGQPISLTSNATAGATYSWSGPQSFTSSLQNPSIPSAVAGNAGTYNLYITVNGCTSATAGTQVTVVNPPSAPSISSNSPVCEGAALQLNAVTTANTAYYWSGPGTWSSGVQNPSIANAGAGTAGNYSCYVVVGGCTSATSVLQVQIASSPTVAYNGAQSYCGSTASLSALANVAAPATISSIDWYAPAAIGSGQNLTHTFGVTLPATVNGFVVATSSNNCADTAVFSIVLNDVPLADFTYEDFCDGQHIVFHEQHSWTGSGGNAPAFLWISGANTDTGSDVSLAFAGPGTYPVTLVVQNSGTVCADSITKQVTVHAVPQASFTYQAECLQEATFYGSVAPDSLISSYSWDFGDGNSGSGDTTSHAYAQSGNYHVTFSVLTSYGCTVTEEQDVEIEKSSLTIPAGIPNIITPNGDGMNDFIDLDLLLGDCGEYEFKVFNRWGNSVYLQTKGSAPFSGKGTNGSLLSPGVYFYVLLYGESKKEGSITIVQ